MQAVGLGPAHRPQLMFGARKHRNPEVLRLRFVYPDYAQATETGQRQMRRHAVGLSETLEDMIRRPPEAPAVISEAFTAVLKQAGMLQVNLFGTPFHRRLYNLARHLAPTLNEAPEALTAGPLRDSANTPGVFTRRLVVGTLAQRLKMREDAYTRADIAWTNAALVFDPEAEPAKKFTRLDPVYMDKPTRRRVRRIKAQLQVTKAMYHALLKCIRQERPAHTLTFQVTSLNSTPQLLVAPESPGPAQQKPA